MTFMKVDQLESQSSLEYWTDERMANAIPISLLQVEIPEEIQQKDDKFSKIETEMFLSGAEYNRWKPLQTKVNVKIDPYRKAGKLYFTRDGKNCFGTAQFVGRQNIILTAAHCLKAPCGEWSTNVIFRRAYKNGGATQHINISMDCAGVDSHWDSGIRNEHLIKWDYGFAKTTLDSNVGYLRLSTDLPYFINAIGYPDNYGNKKRYMQEANGIRGHQNNGRVLMRDNFMDYGSSGGAWFPRYLDNAVVGLNSAVDLNGNVYGPVFDQNTINVFTNVLHKDS